MKKFIYIFLLILSYSYANSQAIKTVYLNDKVTTHFLSKVNIDQIDLSTTDVDGTIYNPKIVAIKPKKVEERELGYLSLIGENYFLQYHLLYTNDINRADKSVKIEESKGDYFLHPNYSMTNIDLYNYSRAIKKIPGTYKNTSSKSNKLIISLNNIIVKDDYIFVDYSILNKTNLQYDVDDIKYSLEDIKVSKNTTSQKELLDIDYTSNKEIHFRKNYRNVVVFKKLTFPDNKVLTIEVSEEQLSGRNIKLYINYLDILNADTI